MDHNVYYVCKYTPIELLRAFGVNVFELIEMRADFERADQLMGANICGFGKTIVEAVLDGEVSELVLVNCCDTIRSVYDMLLASGKLDFLYLIDMPHADWTCNREWMTRELSSLANAYAEYSGLTFDPSVFRSSFDARERVRGPHVKIMGARMGGELFDQAQKAIPYPVENSTCVSNRTVGEVSPPETDDESELFAWYSKELTSQLPCMRMHDPVGRRRLYNDPDMVGIIYHTVRFCDFYSGEYMEVKNSVDVPVVKIESDYTTQSAGQMETRLGAFAESILPPERMEVSMANYFAGIDSGSTSTDVAIVDKLGNLVASVIIPTGAGASISADAALEQALAKVGFKRGDIGAIVSTGYGRSAIQLGDRSITEITCHARGAHHLNPAVRCVIDIGGQDSKAISIDEDGNVVDFTMNDKCAAGTGRFLDTMARTLDMSLDELSQCGIVYNEDLTISSMCTVFAESEVVGLRAQNKAVDDIVHGLDKAVAIKTTALVKRIHAEPPFMMTGGVSKNAGVVKALEERLESPVLIHEHAQLCGAIGAALFAAGL